MHSLANDYPATLLAEHKAPCLSLYQRTHRQHPENQQDPVRFRNLVRQLAELLRAPDFFRVYRLQRPVAELAVVADGFHTKPLMRIAQSADSYQILGLNRHAFRVFEGNRDVLDERPPIAGVPQTADELLGKDSDVREGAHRAHGPDGTSATRHGTDVKQDVEDRDTEQFFRAADSTVLKHWSKPSGYPLILAALRQHHHLFRAVSVNPSLMDEAIDVHPDTLSQDALRERAWQVVLPRYEQRLAGFVELFGTAMANGRGAESLPAIAEAAVAGRVETLLLEADRLLPGWVDASSGQIMTADPAHPEVDDVFDDLGEIVLKKRGEVILVPVDRMPTGSGAAAIFRF